MKFDFEDLNDEIREFMQDELVTDINNGQLYLSKRFNQKGIDTWAEILSESIVEQDENWLSQTLSIKEVFNEYEERASGIAKIPSNAAQVLAQTEFNRFYIRGVCRKAIEKNIKVIVYRARESSSPKPESENKIGMILDPHSLLLDLKANKSFESFLGIAQVNSGLSVRLDN